MDVGPCTDDSARPGGRVVSPLRGFKKHLVKINWGPDTQGCRPGLDCAAPSGLVLGELARSALSAPSRCKSLAEKLMLASGADGGGGGCGLLGYAGGEIGGRMLVGLYGGEILGLAD